MGVWIFFIKFHRLSEVFVYNLKFHENQSTDKEFATRLYVKVSAQYEKKNEIKLIDKSFMSNLFEIDNNYHYLFS